MSDIKETLKAAGQKVTDAAKSVGTAVTKKAEEAKNWVDEHVDGECGEQRNLTDIEYHMDVIASCGRKMGKVDRVEGDAIKLTRKDSSDGEHHYIPSSWVDHVDEHVHLNRNSEETRKDWKSDAASCGSCGN